MKHIFWGIIILVIAVLGSYVGLTISGHPEEAQKLGAGALGALGVSAWLAVMYLLLG